MGLGAGIRNALWAWKNSAKAKGVTVAILLIAAAGVAGYVLFGGGEPASLLLDPTPLNANETTATALRRAIDGVTVPPAEANAFPVAIVVENLVAARPQAGLDRANLVVETLAEGGITRFLAIFASSDHVGKIGPVRSARQVHLPFVKELDALYFHAGGSPGALTAIPEMNIRDLNQFFHSQYYWRDAERRKTKALEHTLYTSAELIARAIRDTEMPIVGTFDPWRFKDDVPLADRPAEPKSVTIDFSQFSYKVEYRYDRVSNAYTRYQAEQPHAMEDGTVITVKNIVVQYTPTSLADEQGRLQIDLLGEGPAVLFQNGAAIDATWKKDTDDDRTRYYDTQGHEISFVAGTTWVEIVPNDREVSYQ